MTNVRDFGARGDGKTDDTASITHAIQKGDGHLVFPRGDYLISRPLHIPLQLHGRIAIDGSGGTARIVMTGAGAALHLVGTHRRSAHPEHIDEAVWDKERFATVQDIEIVGRHAQADGIYIEAAMQPTLSRVLIRRCRHGVHLANRDRNVLLDSCHIYQNSGIGVFLDRVNLHQTIIHGCHISYNRQAGIKVVGSEIRNIQITGNDIEYNHDLKREGCTDVLFDCREGTLREGTLVSNTIQAVRSPGGANVRFLGAKDHPNAVGLFAITGNLIGSQARALDLHACRAVVVSGNSIYSGYEHSIWLQDSEHVVISGNSIDHNPQYKGTSTDQVVLRNCRNVNVTGLIVQHTREATQPVDTSVEISGCQNVNVVGCQIVNARVRGITLSNSSLVRIADCTIRGREGDKEYRGPVAVDAKCRHLMVVNNFLDRGSDGPLEMPAEIGTAAGNVTV